MLEIPLFLEEAWAFVSFFRNIYSICSNFNELSALDELLSVKNSLLSVIGFLPAFRLHLKWIYVFYWWIFAVSTSKFEPYASWCRSSCSLLFETILEVIFRSSYPLSSLMSSGYFLQFKSFWLVKKKVIVR